MRLIKLSKNFYFNNMDLVFLFLFFISFLHPVLGLIFNLILMLYWIKGVEGCLKALIFLTTRGILNPVIAVPAAFQVSKWLILLGSACIILSDRRLIGANRRKYNAVFVSVAFFFIVVFLFGFITSSYPVTAAFKLVSFVLTFLAVLKGVAITTEYFCCCEFFVGLYTILFLVSMLMIPFAQFRVVNADFQGIFNHVNLFGIVAAIYIAAILNSLWFNKHRLLRNSMIIGIFTMIYLSASRTGMISAVLVVLIYLIGNKRLLNMKTLSLAMVSLLVLVIISGQSITNLQNSINDFLYKNNAESIWSSRAELIYLSQQRYEEEPLFGTGFMVPYEKEIKDYSLNFDLIIEPGNLVWALLGDTGLVGLFLFGIIFFVILINGKARHIHLLFGAYVVCMGEMVFFSVNNMSILLYILIGTYLFDEKRGKVLQ